MNIQINVDQELKTLRGQDIRLDKDTNATFAIVVEACMINDPKILGIESKHKAKKIALKCIQGGEQEFTPEEIGMILESTAQAIDTSSFCSIESILNPEAK